MERDFSKSREQVLNMSAMQYLYFTKNPLYLHYIAPFIQEFKSDLTLQHYLATKTKLMVALSQ